MQISDLIFLLLLFFVSPAVQGIDPSPSPSPSPPPGFSVDEGSPAVDLPPPIPAGFGSPAPAESSQRGHGAPGPAPEVSEGKVESKDVRSGEIPADPPVPEGAGEATVRWCAVGRDEFLNCQTSGSQLNSLEGYTWTCVERGTTQECLNSIKKGEADLIDMDAGLAYIAFLNYSMKAIAAETYCNRAKAYPSVALVNRDACKSKEGKTTLMDFKGLKSCHGAYSSAAGWNYPVSHLTKLADSEEILLNDRELANGFFTKVCAPSGFEGLGVCNGCGTENGTCEMDSVYLGHSGAFRCLMEGLGDIAFLREDTAVLYSVEGPLNQTWSTKSIRDFMYLCPQGGCREINGYPGECSLGTVPANVIMASNSILNEKRLFILKTLLNASWIDGHHSGRESSSYPLSPSTEGITAVKNLTRSHLGISASISQSIQEMNTRKAQITPSTVDTNPGLNPGAHSSSSSFGKHGTIIMHVAIFTSLLISS